MLMAETMIDTRTQSTYWLYFHRRQYEIL